MLATQVAALRLIGAALGPEVPFIATVFSPLSQAKHMAGAEQVLSHMRHYPLRNIRALRQVVETS